MDAEIVDQRILLSWSTATETANLGFILEKKTDSLITWDPLASYLNSDALLGQGTVSTQTEYSFTDSLVARDETYYYRVSGVDEANNIGLLDSLSITVTETSVKYIIPNEFDLTVYPNPFNPVTRIGMYLEANCNTAINIYNAQGHHVKQLYKGYVNAGEYKLIWDAGGMPSGVYFCVINVGGRRLVSQKLVLLK